MEDDKTILVLGMHRSGTSVVAGLLNILGVKMGDNLIPKDVNNVSGYYEDAEFHELNREILHAAGGNWHQPPSEEAINKQINFNHKIKKLVENKQGLWGWKDPRTVLTANLYVPHLTNPVLVICNRKTEEVVRSLQKRDKFISEKSYQLINDYKTRINNFVSNHPEIPQIEISYNRVVENPIQEMEKVANFLNVEFTTKARSKVKKFILSKEKIQKQKKLISNYKKLMKIIKKIFIRKES